MRDTSVKSFILHAPVKRKRIADRTHQVTHWGAPGEIFPTDFRLRGIRYTGIYAYLPSDEPIAHCLSACYGAKCAGALQRRWIAKGREDVTLIFVKKSPKLIPLSGCGAVLGWMTKAPYPGFYRRLDGSPNSLAGC